MVGWKINHKFLKPVRRNIRTSLVEAFASFIYLSCSQLLLAYLFNVLYHVHLQPTVRCIDKKILCNEFTDSGIFWKSTPSICIVGHCFVNHVFYIANVFALLYPSSWFQNILNKLRCNHIVLHTFMDVFQGGYKDGITGKRDYRYFSGFVLLFPLLIYLTFILTKTRYFYPIICFWITLYLTLHQPFKYFKHNYIFTAMLFVLLGGLWGMGSIVLDPVLVYPPFSQRPFSPLVLITTPLIVPSIYLCGLVGVLFKKCICIWLQNST